MLQRDHLCLADIDADRDPGPGGSPARRADAAGNRARAVDASLCLIALLEEDGSAWYGAAASDAEDVWRQRRVERRYASGTLWPDVGSIVMLGLNYGPRQDPLAGLAAKSAGNLSVYARNRDYHDVIKGRLKELAAWLVKAAPCEVKVLWRLAPPGSKPSAFAS